MSFWCLEIDQKTNEIVVRISALASKKMSNQKSSVRESKYNHPISGIKCPYFFFDLTSFKRLGQKPLQTFHWYFGQFEDTKRKFRN